MSPCSVSYDDLAKSRRNRSLAFPFIVERSGPSLHFVDRQGGERWLIYLRNTWLTCVIASEIDKLSERTSIAERTRQKRDSDGLSSRVTRIGLYFLRFAWSAPDRIHFAWVFMPKNPDEDDGNV